MGAGPVAQGRGGGYCWAMSQPLHLRVYLDEPWLTTAIAGKFGFFNRLCETLEPRGWTVAALKTGPEARAKAPTLPGYALFHMERPTHPRALTFRLAYHFPYWRIEKRPERWRFGVAKAAFDPAAIAASDFSDRLRQRVLPGPAPRDDGFILIALQSRLQKERSFQAMSPLNMVARLARTGRDCIATLHPKVSYGEAERDALESLARRNPNLRIGGDTASLIRRCSMVATQNSGAGFDGLILHKPVLMFGQSDYHHIALNVADLGFKPALEAAARHRPDYDRYVEWFLRHQSLDMMAPDATGQITATLGRHGWPVG